VLVQLREPVNKFPQLVGYLVRVLKRLCPTLGKRKIAEVLARAGLHLSATTVHRMLKEPALPEPVPISDQSRRHGIRAKHIHHTWHVDLSVVPIVSGFWTPWLPFALPQCWPFCWWVAVVVDHVSRRALGVAVFAQQPMSKDVRALLARAIRESKATPKHLICDKGTQFNCRGFRHWCRRSRIAVRYGAVGRHGSIAVVERFIRTLKEGLRLLVSVPMRREAFRRELTLLADWYNEFRPHAGLSGRTPNEVYFARFPATRRPRYEPRPRWPRGSPCAKPWALTRGQPGAQLELHVDYHAGRRHLPIVTLRRAA
jgi:transposase InsO family protein